MKHCPFFLERMHQARRVQAIDDFAALINLQLSRRRSAGRGLERRPNHSAGGLQADSREHQKKERKQSLPASTLSYLHLNEISRSFI